MKPDWSAGAVRALAAAAFAIVFGCAAYYVFSSVPPYGFYYDLGGNIVATSLIANWMRGFADLWDAFGWAGWGERTAFTYAPMTGYVFAVPIAKLFGGNAIAAVKAMQVLDFGAAWASAAYLYRVLRGRTAWAWIAGLVYALLPYNVLMIRGNFEFGMVSALAPLLFASPIALIRRYGLAALPLCGAIAGLIGTNVVVEYAIFAGIPACCTAIGIAYDRTKRLVWACAGAGAFVAFLAVSAYTAIPTLASHALFAAPAPVDALLQGGEFSVFSESPLALASLLLNESLANPRPEFSLGPMVWIALAAGVVLWVLAVAWIVRCARARFAFGERALAICAGVCALISLGSSVPGVNLVWWLIAHLPGIDMVRTPDRFIALVVPAVTACAVSSVEYLVRSVKWRAVAYGSLGAVLACSFALFFVFRVFLGDTYSVEERMPNLEGIDAVAVSRGNRVANLALVDQGSVFDTSLYGMMVPNIDFASDFTQRYEGDGLGGTGMLARADVATVIATPPWTKDSPLIAQASIARAAFLHPLEGDATTVAAYGVDPVRGFIHPVEPACLYGGPGMLDYLEVLPAFAETAFLPNGRDCARALYTDSAPSEVVLHGTIVASIPGVELFQHSGVLRDIDYRIALGRFFLNIPWYRNAIDGDSPQIGDGAVSLDTGNTGSAPFSVPHAGNYFVAIRAVCHGAIDGTVRVDSGAAIAFRCEPAPGFTWTKVPVGRLAAGAHQLAIAVGAMDTNSPLAQTTWHFGLDGAVAVAGGAAPPPQHVVQAFAFSAARMATGEPFQPAGTLSLVDAPGFEAVPGAAHGGNDVLLSRTADAVAHYRFSGRPGRYRIVAAAYVDASRSGGTYLGILDGARCCVALSSLSLDRGPQLYVEGVRFLHPGDVVGIALHTTANDPIAISQLLSVSIESDPAVARPDDSRSHYGAWFDYLARAKRENPQIPGGPTPVPGHAALTPYFGMQLWTKPVTLSVASFPSGTANSPTAFTATLVGAGSALVRLSCGADTVSARLGAPGGDVTLPQSAAPDCSVQLVSTDAGLYLQRAAITRAIARIDLRGSRWIAAGTYDVAAIRRGAGAAGGTVSVDGVPVRGSVRVARDGMHELQWRDAPSDAYMLAFVPTTWPRSLPGIIVRQDASQRWSIHLDRAASLEGAVLEDGHWRLTGVAGGSFAGASCDLSNTCFASVPPGDYRLWHEWPGYILVGLAITLLAWLGAGGLLFFAARKT